MQINALHAIDFYKTDHRRQYPTGTTEVYANFTPRSDKLANMLPDFDHHIVFFGLQYFIKDYLIDCWNKTFFNQPRYNAVFRYKRRMDTSLGKDSISVEHIEALHDLGYLPIKIKALSEGIRVPIGVPVLTIVNTHPDFFWLTNYIESVLSCYLWQPITSATIAYEYRRLLSKYASLTGSSLDFVRYQAHDFSFRGMTGYEAAAKSGAGHLTSFYGTDTVLAIDFMEDYYHANPDKEMIGCSVPATEHSVMCMGTKDGEYATFKRLVTETYPQGILSIVSDTWDFWKVITEYLANPEMKHLILNRNGKIVIRPDSGDPVKIICGDSDAEKGSPQYKGAIRCLWEIFGGTRTEIGNYCRLDSHIGLIYGDSITLQRANEILERLSADGFASDCVVFGVGSYTYQHVTRDTFGWAVKATSGVVNNERRDIFKDPKTDDGRKKSAKGLLGVVKDDYLQSGTLKLLDNLSVTQEQFGLLKEVFKDGNLLYTTSLSEIRARIDGQL